MKRSRPSATGNQPLATEHRPLTTFRRERATNDLQARACSRHRRSRGWATRRSLESGDHSVRLARRGCGPLLPMQHPIRSFPVRMYLAIGAGDPGDAWPEFPCRPETSWVEGFDITGRTGLSITGHWPLALILHIPRHTDLHPATSTRFFRLSPSFTRWEKRRAWARQGYRMPIIPGQQPYLLLRSIWTSLVHEELGLTTDHWSPPATRHALIPAETVQLAPTGPKDSPR